MEILRTPSETQGYRLEILDFESSRRMQNIAQHQPRLRVSCPETAIKNATGILEGFGEYRLFFATSIMGRRLSLENTSVS